MNCDILLTLLIIDGSCTILSVLRNNSCDSCSNSCTSLGLADSFIDVFLDSILSFSLKPKKFCNLDLIIFLLFEIYEKVLFEKLVRMGVFSSDFHRAFIKFFVKFLMWN